MVDCRKVNLSVLVACHNRREATIRSLRSVLKQKIAANVSLNFFVVDDGSTDGTADAVKTLIPHVNLVYGDGTLFWTRSMRIAMKTAYHAGCDLFLCLNDDTELFPGALSCFLDAVDSIAASFSTAVNQAPVIVTGAIVDPHTKIPSYGGLARNSTWHPLRFRKVPPNGKLQPCDVVNMNATLVTRSVIYQIGLLARQYRQGGGDYDFALRAKKAGIPVVMTKDYVGECELNPLWTAPPRGSSFQRYRRLFTVKQQPPWERSVYYRRYGGLLWPLLWIAPYLTFWFKEASRAFRRRIGA